MTKSGALNNFFSSFGIDAYPSTSVPDETTFPWLTYENSIGNYGDSPIGISVNLYYYTESEAIPNLKVEEIATAIGMGGIMLPYDDGAIWLKRGEPWCLSLEDATDNTIKRRQLNVILEYL